MIYAAVKPIEEYVVEYDGTVYGIYEEYKYEPELLSLIMISTAIPYDYEIPGVPPEYVSVSVGLIEPYYKTLDEEIDGVRVGDLLSVMNPLEFFKLIDTVDLSHLSLVREVFIRKDVDLSMWLPMLIAARAAEWAVNYRGETETKGNVVSVNFKRGLTISDYVLDRKKEVKEGVLRQRGERV